MAPLEQILFMILYSLRFCDSTKIDGQGYDCIPSELQLQQALKELTSSGEDQKINMYATRAKGRNVKRQRQV